MILPDNGPGVHARAPDGDAIPVALYSCLKDTAAQVRSVTWAELAETLTKFDERTDKDGPLWSPVTFKADRPSKRNNENIATVTAFTFDYDHLVPPWALLDGLEYRAHTTHTHHADDPKCGRLDCPHWRVVVKIAAPIAAADYTEAWQRLVFWLAPEADRSCKDESRGNYLPSCLPGAPRETRSGEGVPVDWTALRPVPVPEAPTREHRPFEPAGNGTGERPGDRFNREATWEEILGRTGAQSVARLSDGSQRWRRPGKRDGPSATTDGGGQRVLYVFTDGWAPFDPNTSYTRFRAYSLLEHNGDDKAAARALAERYGMHEQRNGHATVTTEAAAGAVRALLDTARETKSCAAVFDTADTLARLSRHEYGKVKAELKEILGSALNLNDLESAVSEIRRAAVANAKAEGDAAVPTANVLADTILADDHFAQDDGGKLWLYRHGVYVPRGAAFVKGRVKAILAAQGVSDEWTSHLASETVEYIRVDAPTLWERPPSDTLNVRNGLLDTRTLTLRPHTPAHLSMVQLPVTYDPSETCPAWETFVAETFPEDARDLAWELAAKLMTSDACGQRATLFVGEGGNGKSTCLTGLRAFIGASNTATLSLQRLELDKFAAARLFGKLANICADLPSAHLSGTSVFKAITGGDPITGEYKYLESFDFVPFASLVFSANHPPQSADGSQAFFDRWDVIPFTQSFRGTGREIPRSELDARLAAPSELSGLLNKALVVLPAVRRRGLSTPASGQAALAEFRAVTDPFAVWLDQATVMHPEAFVPKGDLLAAYNASRKNGGGTVMTATAFGRSLRRLRPTLDDGQRMLAGVSTWVWLGIGLRAPNEPPPGRYNESVPHAVNAVNAVSPNCFVPAETPSPLGGEGRVSGTQERQLSENRVNRVNPVNDDADDDLLICATDGCPNIVTMPGLACDDCLAGPTVPEAFR